LHSAINSFLKRHRELYSLRFQLFAVILVLGAALLFVLRGFMINMSTENMIEFRANSIVEQMNSVANHMEAAGFIADSSSMTMNTELSLLATESSGRVIVTDSDFMVVYDSYSLSLGKYMVASQLLKSTSGKSEYSVDDEGKYLNIAVPVYYSMKSTVVPEGYLYVKSNMDDIYVEINNMKKTSMITVLIMLLILGIISFLLGKFFASPLIKLTNAIDSVASFEDGDIGVVGYMETETITRAFNSQRMRLKTLDDSRQEFVSNVSHELKTPIASMKVLADSLITQEDAPIEMYRDFMMDIVEEVDRENKIITDLLTLVHMDQGKEGLNIQLMDVNEMIELIIKRLIPIANESGVEIIFETTGDIYAEIDEVKMTLAITNLMENGIKYNVEGGYVRIFTTIDHQFLTIEVSDSGIGIPKEAIPHIYERFYRVDKSHSKEIGGTGLGLPITRKIILLHRGSIKCDSGKGMGTIFTVRIPLYYAK